MFNRLDGRTNMIRSCSYNIICMHIVKGQLHAMEKSPYVFYVRDT